MPNPTPKPAAKKAISKPSAGKKDAPAMSIPKLTNPPAKRSKEISDRYARNLVSLVAPRDYSMAPKPAAKSIPKAPAKRSKDFFETDSSAPKPDVKLMRTALSKANFKSTEEIIAKKRSIITKINRFTKNREGKKNLDRRGAAKKIEKAGDNMMRALKPAAKKSNSKALKPAKSSKSNKIGHNKPAAAKKSRNVGVTTRREHRIDELEKELVNVEHANAFQRKNDYSQQRETDTGALRQMLKNELEVLRTRIQDIGEYANQLELDSSTLEASQVDEGRREEEAALTKNIEELESRVRNLGAQLAEEKLTAATMLKLGRRVRHLSEEVEQLADDEKDSKPAGKKSNSKALKLAAGKKASKPAAGKKSNSKAPKPITAAPKAPKLGATKPIKAHDAIAAEQSSPSVSTFVAGGAVVTALLVGSALLVMRMRRRAEASKVSGVEYGAI